MSKIKIKLGIEDALRGAMAVPPPEGKLKPKRKKKAAKKAARKKKP